LGDFNEHAGDRNLAMTGTAMSVIEFRHGNATSRASPYSAVKSDAPMAATTAPLPAHPTGLDTVPPTFGEATIRSDKPIDAQHRIG
jgi:hypothetical protein